MKRWSRLKRDIESLMSDKVNFEIFANSYKNGIGQALPRIYVSINKKIIWDWPKDFFSNDSTMTGNEVYLFTNNTSKVTQSIRDYINTPIQKLSENSDPYNLYPILFLCDRRVGKRKLLNLKDAIFDPTLQEIIDIRLK